MLMLSYLIALSSVQVPTAEALAAQAALTVPDETALDVAFVPATSSTRGGRAEVRGALDGVPFARTLAKVWIGHGGMPLVVSGGGPAGPLVGGTTPSVSLAAALAILEHSGVAGSRGAPVGKLVIDNGPTQSRLAWRIDPPLDPVTLDNRVFLVDAHTGTFRVAFNRTRAALVEAFPVNPVETPVAEVFELNDVDETAEFLEGQFFRVRNCVLPDEMSPCTYGPTLTADTNGDFYYPVPDISIASKNQARDDAYAEISAYYNADRFHAFLATLGDPGILCSQGDSQATITVNQHSFVGGEPQWFANAFYTGACDSTIVMGQAETVDFGWDGEIVLHELGHGITDRQTGEDGTLGLPRRDEHSVGNDAGAINEGTSDYFGTVLSGERIYGNYSGPQFQRDLGTDMTCPAGLAGEIHDDGILWATALHDVTDELGLDFVAVVIDTLGMLPLDVSFDEAAGTLETLTRDAMGEDAGDVVSEVMDARGLAQCERIAPIEDAEYGMWLLPTNWIANYNPVRPPPFQVQFTVPENATRLTVTFEPFDFVPEGEEPNWSVDLVLKQDEPIIFTYEDFATYTRVDADSTEQHSFEDNTWSRDVQGGELFYGAFLNRGNALMRMDNIGVEYELSDPATSTTGTETGDDSTATDTNAGTSTGQASSGGSPMTTTGVSAGEGEAGEASVGTGSDTDSGGANRQDAGCGCQTRSPSLPASGVLLLLLLGIRRRRRP